jgi:hypothetical protein
MKRDEGPGWDHSVVKSGKVGRVGTLLVVDDACGASWPDMLAIAISR